MGDDGKLHLLFPDRYCVQAGIIWERDMGASKKLDLHTLFMPGRQPLCFVIQYSNCCTGHLCFCESWCCRCISFSSQSDVYRSLQEHWPCQHICTCVFLMLGITSLQVFGKIVAELKLNRLKTGFLLTLAW